MVTEPSVKMRPIGSKHHVRFVEAAKETAGGIILPDNLGHQYTTGEILASGPGYAVPGLNDRTIMWGSEVDVVVFFTHHLEMLSEKEACIRDEHLVAYVDDDGTLSPMNDWVSVSLVERSANYPGSSIIIPEDRCLRPNLGVVQDWGPGFLRLSGPYFGSRKSVPGIIGIAVSDLWNAQVYWGDDAECLDLDYNGVGYVFVRAGDLLMRHVNDVE